MKPHCRVILYLYTLLPGKLKWSNTVHAEKVCESECHFWKWQTYFCFSRLDWPWDDFRIFLRECRAKASQRLDGKLSKIGKTSRKWNRAGHFEIRTHSSANHGCGIIRCFTLCNVILSFVSFQDEKNQILTTNVWLNLVSFNKFFVPSFSTWVWRL